MRVVLDCSVAIGFFFEEEKNAYTEAAKSRIKHGLKILVPPLFHCEVSNVLYTQEKRNRWTRQETEDCLRDLRFLSLITVPLLMSPEEIPMLLALARDHNLTTYDASYLLLAHQEKVPLATQDKALAKAAKDSGCYFEG